MVKLKPFFHGCKLLVFLLAVLLLSVSIWLVQGERSLEWARPMIEARINSADSPYVVNFGDVRLDWRDLKRFGLLKVEKITVSGRDGALFASLPRIYVGLDPLGFLPQRRSLNTIIVPSPKIFLTRDADKVLRLGLGDADRTTPLSVLRSKSDAGGSWNGTLPFRHLRVDRMKLVLNDEVTGKRLEIPNAQLTINRAFGHYYNSALSLPFTYGEAKGSLMATLKTAERGHHVLATKLDNAPMDFTCIVAACPAGMDIRGNINGELQLALDDAMDIQGIAADLKTGKATFTAPTWFPEPLELSDSSIDARADSNMQVTHLTKLELGLADTRITANVTAEKKKDGWYVNGHGVADKLDIEKLYKYWPVTLASDSRTWITSSLKSGYGENATIDFKLKPSDFTAPHLSDESIAATIDAHGITVNYLPGFPEMHDVNGLVTFTGSTIDIATTSGTLLSGTTISKADIKALNLNEPATPMAITVALKAPATDAATLLKLEHFTFDDGLKLNPATIKGMVDGTLKFNFDAFSKDRPGAKPVPEGQISFENVQYDIETKIIDLSQPKFADGFDLSGVNGTLKATNDGMTFDGDTKVGNATSVKVSVAQKSGGDVELGIDGTVERSQFAGLGLPEDSHFGEGTATISAKLTAKKDEVLLKQGLVTLNDMALNIPEIGWEKKRGAAATVELAPKGKDFMLNIKAAGLSASNATLRLTPAMGVAELNLPRVQSGKSDFALRYRTIDDRMDIALTGAKLDASNAFGSSENSILADFPAINLKLDLGELVLVPAMPLKNVKGSLSCTKARCDSANLSANAGAGSVQGSISRDENGRQFSMTSDNAGDFLRALDITDRMYKGRMSMMGTYDDSVTPPALPAKFEIKDFTLKNSQILARILSIGSLTGLANVLTGNGIAFDKMTVDIHSRAGLITVMDGKASGNAMGITVAGTVDTRSSSLKLKGALVPAFALNSILSRIPLIGMLAGGDEGLIAFNYSINGPYGDPSIFVNPLSGFTPGFLRGIWGSNQPANPIDEDVAKGTKPAPATVDNAQDRAEKPAPGTVRRHQMGIGQ